MSDVDIIRAWKDPAYRRSLTPEQRAALPEHPAGFVELSDDQLVEASGGKAEIGPVATTAMTCTQHTFGGWKACGCGAIFTTALNCTNYTFGGFKSCGC